MASIKYTIMEDEEGHQLGHPLTRADEGSAGWDIRTSEDFDLSYGDGHAFRTHLKLELPPGTYGRVAPRSGLAMKGLDDLGGVIDCSYRGEVRVILINFNRSTIFKFVKGDRIAQLIVTPYVSTPFELTTKELSSTERGEGGFGSSGLV